MKRTLAFLAFATAAGVSFAQQDEAPKGPVVELPKFVVSDDRVLPQPESWLYATIPGFEILSNGSEKATQRMLRDFDMFRQALGYVWPVPTKLTQSTSLIICGRGGKFDSFKPKEANEVELAKASLFLKRGDHAAIVIDLQATTLNVLDVDGADAATTGTDSGLVSVEHDKQLYREYVRYLMSQSEPRSPAWLEEGLSQIIMKMQFDKRWIEFAKLEDPNEVSAAAASVMAINQLAGGGDDGADSLALPGAPAEDRDFAAALRRKALVPMEKFFAVKHDSVEANNPLGNNRWAKQAYAFVHMCLYGNRGKLQKPFMTFLQRSAREPVTEQMFKECFKMSFKDMLMEIRSYCDFQVYEAKIYQSKKGGPDLIVAPQPVKFREATQSEIGRIKGEAFLLGDHVKEARTEFTAPYIRGERDPELVAALGIYDLNNGEPERGRKFLEFAYTAKSKRPDANLALARLRYNEALAAGPEARLSAVQLAGVIGPLNQSRGQPPFNPALYELAGDALLRSTVTPTKDDAKLLIEGAQLFPTRMKLIYQAALISGRAGELQPAHALADHGIKYGPDASVKKRFEDLKASLPPAPPKTENDTPAAAPAAGAAKKQ